MRRIQKKVLLFLIIFPLAYILCTYLPGTLLAQSANVIVNNLSYEWRKDALVITLETAEPSDLVCHSVKNPPSIIITSPSEIFTNQPLLIKIGGTIKTIRAVKGLKKIPEELDSSYYSVSFFVVDLNKPKKFESSKEDIKFLLFIKENMARGSKKPFYSHIGDLIEKISPSEEAGSRRQPKKVAPQKATPKAVSNKEPISETKKETKRSSVKGLEEQDVESSKRSIERDKEMESVLQKFSESEGGAIEEKQETQELFQKEQPRKKGEVKGKTEKISASSKESKKPAQESTVPQADTSETEAEEQKPSRIDIAESSVRNILSETEKTKRSLARLRRENIQEEDTVAMQPQEETVETSINEPIPEDIPGAYIQPSSQENVEKKLTKKEKKKLAKMDTMMEKLLKKEEERKVQEIPEDEVKPDKPVKKEKPKQPTLKKISASTKAHKADGQTQDTIQKLTDLKEELNQAIESRIQAELLKDNSAKQWETSKKQLDTILSE
ncbi:MAG: hypothetical protein V1893_02050 [Candidatus Omnitrophota bacterium]